MTYQTSPDNFPAPCANSRGFAGEVLSKIAAFFSGIGHSFVTAIEASSRIDRIEALNAKSDEELAAMGLRRDQIAQFVFQDLFYC
jgi:hypothetical protein